MGTACALSHLIFGMHPQERHCEYPSHGTDWKIKAKELNFPGLKELGVLAGLPALHGGTTKH